MAYRVSGLWRRGGRFGAAVAIGAVLVIVAATRPVKWFEVPRRPPAPPRPQQRWLQGTVIGVPDGDSLVVRADSRQYRVRLEGIDCPEFGQAFGKEAKQFTRATAWGKSVLITSHGTDQYDRVVGYVRLPDGRVLNAALIRSGLAWWYRRHSQDREFERLEAEARAEHRGLWSRQNPQPPWRWRREHPRQPTR